MLMENIDFIIDNGALTWYIGRNGDVTIPSGVTRISDGAFAHCSCLTSAVIPESVVEIDSGAFWNCSNLASIAIPDSVAKIGWSAFLGCSSLKDVHYAGTRDQWEKIMFGSENRELLEASVHFAGGGMDATADAGASTGRSARIRVIDGVEYVRLDDLGLIADLVRASARERP